jgi:hypothetical protein
MDSYQYALLVPSLTQQTLEIASQNDYFFEEALLEICLDSTVDGRQVSYRKRDFLFRSGLWRGEWTKQPRRGEPKTLLVTGHSDRSLGFVDLIRLRFIMGIQAVWSSNLRIPLGLATILSTRPIPLGLSNPTHESLKHEVFGDSKLIARAVLEGPFRSNNELTIYANFDWKTAPWHRKRLFRLCSKIPHVVNGTVEISKDGRLRYLREMRDCGLVLCPRGNGMDTHRFYEALYVGAIPIVLKSSYSARLAKHHNLPHIALNNWSEVGNLEKIKQMAIRSIQNLGDLTKIRRSYWESEFLKLGRREGEEIH